MKFHGSKKRLIRIALTGGIGAGKSLALDLLKRKGVPVLQTDYLGHLILKDKKIVEKLSRIFGKAILDPRGRIDRKKLAREAFQSSLKQKKLNKIMHPLVRKKVSEWIRSQGKKSSVPFLVVVEVPLIFERGYYRFFDGVLSISSFLKTRRERLLKRGWTLDEIRRREKLQWTQSRKNKKSDWVIFNNAAKNDLNYAIDRWLLGFENSRSLNH